MNRLMQGRGRRGDFAELAVGLNMLSWTESKQVLQGIGEKNDQKMMILSQDICRHHRRLPGWVFQLESPMQGAQLESALLMLRRACATITVRAC